MRTEALPTLAAVARLAAGALRPFLLMVELKCDTSLDSADPVALAAEEAADVEADQVFADIHADLIKPAEAPPKPRPKPRKPRKKPEAKA